MVKFSNVLNLMGYIDNLKEEPTSDSTKRNKVCEYLNELRGYSVVGKVRDVYIDPWNALYIGDLRYDIDINDENDSNQYTLEKYGEDWNACFTKGKLTNEEKLKEVKKLALETYNKRDLKEEDDIIKYICKAYQQRLKDASRKKLISTQRAELKKK